MKSFPLQITMRHFTTILLASALSSLAGCVSLQTDDHIYKIGAETTRTDAKGNTEKWSQDNGWVSTKQPEANLPRLAVWHLSLHESGIKAWKYGLSSDDNRRYIDPLSPIVSTSGLSETGWATYTTRGNKDDDFIVKRANFIQQGPPEVIGTLERQRGEWRFTGRDGQTYAAYGYHLTSKGILLFRSQSVFTYLPSREPRAHQLPEGWTFAWSQRGDVESSRMLIVQKAAVRTWGEPNNYLIGFFDIDRGKITQEIKMHLPPGNEEAAFQNRFHLYSTSKGPMSIALEDMLKHVTVRNLRTGEKRVAFERNAGIARVQATRQNTGRILIKAEVGFSDEYIYDAEDFLYNGNRVPPEAPAEQPRRSKQG